jgi:UDP-N-acetylmuramoyl-L-alanyl-D-glutamate--2,6-diaminopimelate ligase
LTTVGVTGTNGKTTVTALVAAAFEYAGTPTTVIGTLSGERTTPESTELQALLAEVRDRSRADGVPRAVSMEVSSHALVQARVDAIRFDVAVFTNLSRDHLDFHGSMAAYGAAKASLFTPERAACGVVNVDDEFGRRLVDGASIEMVPVTRAMATDVRVHPGATEFTWRGQRVHLALTGGFNVDNALVAAEAARARGLSAEQVAAGLSRAAPVPGRMQVVRSPESPGVPSGAGGPVVLVDYAHTPAALATALAEARALVGAGPGGVPARADRGATGGADPRLIVVFGCGGDRDAGKRPEMGAVAGALADRVWLTDDNPRHEDPSAIVEQVRAGIPATARVVVERDRRAAITAAVTDARPGDVVLVAGKGHETYQQTGDERVPFDDRTVAAEALAARSGSGSGPGRG